MPQSEADVDNVDQIFAWQKMQRQLSKRLKGVLPKKDFMDRYGKEEGVRMEKKRENGFDTHTTHVCRNHKYRQQSAHRNILCQAGISNIRILVDDGPYENLSLRLANRPFSIARSVNDVSIFQLHLVWRAFAIGHEFFAMHQRHYLAFSHANIPCWLPGFTPGAE